MPKIKYVDKKFRDKSLELIDKINEVIDEYTAQGYSLTLRQCYYQLVARGIIENNQKVYKTTGNLINDARLAGLIDWNAIEDRTRNLKQLSHWDSPQSIIRSAAYQFRRDVWKYQEYYIEVWVEKEALANVVGRVADELDVSYFCCRGYVSQSEMWASANRFKEKQKQGKECVLIHLGDHDPSGIDMSRDIEERLNLFGCYLHEFRRIALNHNQIAQFNPPPNPAKLTDSRVSGYIALYGDKSWELDALEPRVLNDLIRTNVLEFYDEDEGNRVKAQMESEREVMNKVADDWNSVYGEYSAVPFI